MRLFNGQKDVTTAGTAVALIASDEEVYVVIIKALSTNSGFIYVGDASVSNITGFILDANEEIKILIDNQDTTPYIDASVNGEGVSYIGWKNENRSRR